MRLLRVELTRLRWRRAVAVLVLLAVAVPVVVFIAVAFNSRPASDADLQQAQAQRGYQREVGRCTRHPGDYLPPGVTDAAATCRSVVSGYFSGRPSLSPHDQLQGSLVGVVTVVALLLLLAAATFTGQDWASGSMSNQLLFDPRRGRLWAAKAAVVTLLGLVVTAVVTTAYWLGVLALAHHRGIDTGSGVARDGLEECARASALVAGLCLGGYALTMLFRSTVVTLGLVVGVSLAGGVLVALLGGPSAGRWEPQNNVLAVVTNDATYYVDGACPGRQGGATSTCSVERHVHARAGATYSGSILVVAGLLSFVAFRRRDVP